MATVYILKGVSCSGKSTFAKKLQNETNAHIIASDNVSGSTGLDFKPNGPEVFSEMERELRTFLTNGKSVIIDATNLTPKRTQRWVDVARQYRAKTICYFINPDHGQLLKNIKKRIVTVWANQSEEEVKNVVFKMKRTLQAPTLCDGFDDIEIINISDKKEICSSEFAQSFIDTITNHPDSLTSQSFISGIIEKNFPEWYSCIGLEQENKNHSLTVYNHLCKTTANVPVKKPYLAFAMFLHDIGKGYNGIKSKMAVLKDDYGYLHKGQVVPVEIINNKVYHSSIHLPNDIINCDGEYHFFNHENLSAQLSCHILERLGVDKHTYLKIITLVQYHMYLPFDFDPFNVNMNPKISRYKGKFKEHFEDLINVRKADILGK